MNRCDMYVIIYCYLLFVARLSFQRLQGSIRGYGLGLLDLRGEVEGRHAVLALLLYFAWLDLVDD
jgi:hypothetical protein